MKNSRYTLQEQFYGSITAAVDKQCEMERENYVEGLEPFEIYRSRQEIEAMQAGSAALLAWTQAFRVIFAEFELASDSVATNELIAGIERIKNFDTSVVQSQTLADCCKFTPELLEKIHQVGWRSYEHGHFSDAAKVFSIINVFDPGYSVNWAALAAALIAENHYAEAINACTIATSLDPHNAVAYLYAARCHKALGEGNDAQKALKNAASHAVAKYAYLLDVIQTELNSLGENR